MRITELVAEAMRVPATATPATFATHGGEKAPTVASVATVAVATPETEEADETRHKAIAALIKSVIEQHDLSCDVKAVIDDFREWPTVDLELMLTDHPIAVTAIKNVAAWHRIWRYGEAQAY